MEQLIPLINRLQDVFTAVGSSAIQLPQLVVVGSQSSGKSSVLEHLVGRDFLPRGQGIVTRRPLILQLINTKDEEEEDEEEEMEDDSESSSDPDEPPAAFPSAPPPTPPPRPPRPGLKPIVTSSSSPASQAEWGEFVHCPGQRFYSFSDIRAEIEKDTERVTRSLKGISPQPISLSIHSPHVLNLTLVDLPGITKVAVGDQPSDIERVINDLIHSYIAPPSSLILAVTPANTDLANSDALKAARAVDPEGRRTMGVLTKLDLMDRGTDAMAALQGVVYPLAHGFVGVVCRSQQDIQQGRSIAQAVKAERAFFAAHPVYRSVAHRLGTGYLASRLSSLLMSHIQQCLPDMRVKLAATIAETHAELEGYGAPALSTDHGSSILLPLVSAFSQSYNDALDGQQPDVSLSELYGGARIGFVFRELFTASIMRLDPYDTLSDADIRTAIHNAAGPRTPLFIPEIAFDLLVKKQIARLLAPALECVELVYKELTAVVNQCEGLLAGLVRFPLLRKKMMRVVHELLKGRVEPCKAVISNFIQCELAYVNTSHPDFIGGSAAVASVMKMQQQQQQQQGGKEGKEGKDREKEKTEERRPSVLDKPSTAAPGAASSDQQGVEISRPVPAYVVGGSAVGSPAQSPLPSARGAGLFSMLWGGSSQQQHLQQQQQQMQASFGASAAAAGQVCPGLPHPSLGSTGSSFFSSSASAFPFTTSSSSSPSSRDVIETLVIKSLISSYFLIVKKSVCDFTPKAIMCHMVNHSRAGLQSAVIGELYVHGGVGVEELMQEGEEVEEKRRSCQELIAILEKAMEIVNQARDYKANA